ncbi:RNA polymerase factor sigma-54 [Hyphococcus flavus]|uniref:RNA polymerase sigma-54 factor n=1 Tax=Hyphococcus flavus TaxID=1866326 RepID=A0AAF0CBT0_9PROT|nr:RNA polymerase factor sigma-54 [Hyphococcus flavus]WDI31765.1 RNA polymerase factor sigma-54 [Hyphococcus flavus]
MALAPKLELRQSQQLVMTPQLQQAIKLLQLSNLELAEYVDDQLEQNPFLERDETPVDGPAERRGQENVAADAPQSPEELTGSRTDLQAETGGETYGEYRPNEWATVSSGRRLDGDEQEFGATLKKEISLADHLTEQLHLATKNSTQLFIGAYIIDMIDEAGYLREDLAGIAERLGADFVEVEETHALITSFDPSGVGARDLKECLKLQLIDADRFDPAMEAFVENIELVAKSDLKGLLKVTGADEEDVRDMIAEVRALTPKPGYAYGGGTVQTIAPDVFVTRSPDGGWKVELNSETLPRILVNQRYYAEIASVGKEDEKDKTYISEQFASANWLAKSLHQRAQTILKVASEIVRQQDAFLAYGVKHLRPLNLKVVADAIEMHESTVSRVTSNKYIATPRGLFELKYFFTASIASSSGGEAHSAESVRHRIRELVAAETKDTVLSDDKIVEILRSEGVDIARRTVAKYRETLNIPSSVQRRRAMLQTSI